MTAQKIVALRTAELHVYIHEHQSVMPYFLLEKEGSGYINTTLGILNNRT